MRPRESSPALRWFRRARLGLYGALCVVVLYGLLRYDTLRLPAEGCSPIQRLQPGTRLVVDVWADSGAHGQVLLFRGPDEELLLGQVADPPASAPEEVWEACRRGALWLVSDAPQCPAIDSRRLGPIEPERVAGRVAFASPF